MTVRLPVLIAACLMAAATTSAQDRPAIAGEAVSVTESSVASGFLGTEAYLVGPEDILDVQVWGNSELSRTVPVRPDGMISLPLVNDILAAGLTPAVLRLQITQRLAEFIPSPEVSVIVREVHSVKIAVLGAVRVPGLFEVKGPATVLEMLARAQGFSEFADRGRIVVLRRHGATTTRIPFNYRQVAEQGSEQDNFPVHAGDIILVP